MTTDEIRQQISMLDVLDKCGLQRPNRAGFIQCPFHKGDREPSMKIYEHDFHCFGCGAHGDIFDFVEKFYSVSFKEAFQLLGGSYEPPSFKNRLAIYKAQKAREMRQKERDRLKEMRRSNNALIDRYREQMKNSEPMSDEWAEAVKALEYQLYINEKLSEEETG